MEAQVQINIFQLLVTGKPSAEGTLRSERAQSYLAHGLFYPIIFRRVLGWDGALQRRKGSEALQVIGRLNYYSKT